MVDNEKKLGARILLPVVMALDFANSLYKYAEDFPAGGDNVSAALIALLHLAPLAALEILCHIIPKIRKKAALARIRAGIAAYLAADVALGLLPRRDEFPRPVGILFYSKEWLESLGWTIFDFRPEFLADTAIFALYWASLGCMLAEISDMMNPSENPGGKISASFKVAVAALASLAVQAALNDRVIRELDGNGGTGEHALGIMFVGLILVAAKLAVAVPTAIISTVGIVCASLGRNRGRRRNRAALAMNSAALAASAALALLVW